MDEWLMPGIPRTIAEDPDMETVRRIRASVTKDTGQVVESDLLLDCPFCGARPYVQVHELDETCVEARVVCPSCHVSTTREYQSWKVSYLGDDLTHTLAIGRAISLWNRRSERTCRVECYPPGYEDNLHYEVCSECGTILTASRTGDRHAARASYCPSCGARTVKEEA